jgi:hypothetical protein
MNAEKLNEVFAKEAKQAHRCYDCGGKVLLRYAPGCTFIHCIKCRESKLALPDWEPAEVIRKWNDLPATKPVPVSIRDQKLTQQEIAATSKA